MWLGTRGLLLMWLEYCCARLMWSGREYSYAAFIHVPQPSLCPAQHRTAVMVKGALLICAGGPPMCLPVSLFHSMYLFDRYCQHVYTMRFGGLFGQIWLVNGWRHATTHGDHTFHASRDALDGLEVCSGRGTFLQHTLMWRNLLDLGVRVTIAPHDIPSHAMCQCKTNEQTGNSKLCFLTLFYRPRQSMAVGGTWPTSCDSSKFCESNGKSACGHACTLPHQA